MPALVIKSFPEVLRTRLKQTAAAHRRSITQETIHLLETALLAEPPARVEPKPVSYWAKRKLLPEYEALAQSGALSGDVDSSVMISEERDARYDTVMNVSLTPELENAVKAKIASGLYNNASEIIREALRESLRRERENEWLQREAAIGFVQLESGQVVKVRSKKEFMAAVRGKS